MTACNMFITTSIKAYLVACSSHTEILLNHPTIFTSDVHCLLYHTGMLSPEQVIIISISGRWYGLFIWKRQLREDSKMCTGM